MGNIRSLQKQFADIVEGLTGLRNELSSFQDRLAGLERDVANYGVVLQRTKKQADDNTAKFLNLALLEEGRSSYRPKKYHTASQIFHK